VYTLSQADQNSHCAYLVILILRCSTIEDVLTLLLCAVSQDHQSCACFAMAVHALTLGPSISVMQFDQKGGAAMKPFLPMRRCKERPFAGEG